MVSLRWLNQYDASFYAKRHSENAAWTPVFTPMLRKVSLILYALALTAVVAWKVFEIDASCHSAGRPVVVQLARGPFQLLEFPSRQPVPRAIILFGSGDGGWSGFEEEIAFALQDQGYEVIGVNFNAYAETDYDLATLQGDFDRIAQVVRQPFGDHAPPLIVGGWSMGAAQAIAVGGGPNPPHALAGLLVVDPCSRGRYGLRLSDRTDFLPTGENTFGVEEFAKTLGNLRVVQWHAADDTIDSRTWLATLQAPHKEIDFARTGHYYSEGREDFLRKLAASVPWILQPERDSVTTNGSSP
jgi:phosphatidylglycerol lysyltransferase